jgi:predicted porin
MKKTIIAASIAAVAAAPAAFADVKISGYASAEYVEDAMRINNDIVFSASEDLGNGMKAAAKYHMFTDTNHTDNNTPDSKTADMSVSLSGDFGTVTAGRQEGFDEGVFAAFSNIDASHDADLEGYFDNGQAVMTRDERLKYVSPSFNGLSIGVNVQDNGTDKTDGSEVMVKYSANGLTVMAGSSDEDTRESTNFAVSYKMGGLELRAAHRNVKVDATAESSSITYSVAQEAVLVGDVTAAAGMAAAGDGAVQNITADGVAVAIGDIIGTKSVTDAVDAVDADATFLGAKYTMGANVVALGMVDADEGDANIYSLQHNFSKNTSVYAVVTDPDGADNTTLIGIATKF